MRWPPTLAILLLAAALSVVAAFAVVGFATHVIPCPDDAASCGLGDVYGVVGSLFYAAVALVVFGVTMFAARSERAIRIVMVALLTPIALVLLFGMAQKGGGRIDLARELHGVLQFIVPLGLVVVVQWAVLRSYLRRVAASDERGFHG